LTQTEQADAAGIGSAPIDPQAESVSRLPATVSPQQERDFYKDSGSEFKLQQNWQELGFLGKFFGASSSAPTNIAGFVAVACLTALIGSLFTSGADIVEARKLLIGLITSALAFIFGAASKK
jgi:hypothetical protein